MSNLPKWIKKIGDNVFEVDPDVIYPELQDQLGLKKLTQYDLEVIFGCMKLDFDLAVRMAGAVEPGRAIERRVKHSPKWALAGHPRGEKDWGALSLSKRNQIITDAYRKIRGFVPNA